MKKLTNILLIVLVLSSCTRIKNRHDLYTIREDSLFNQIIDSIILPDSSWRKHLLVPPIFPEDLSSLDLRRQHDSLLQIWDTSQLYIAFGDSLLVFSRFFNLDRYKDTISYFKYNLYNLDTSYYSLFKKCLTDTSLKNRKIHIENFATNYKYKIISDDYVQNMTYKGLKVVEVNLFSRVIFNDAFDRACFCQASMCGRLCGSGYMIFLEKKKGKWKIVERKLLYVS